jgi:hypothetical protein
MTTHTQGSVQIILLLYLFSVAAAFPSVAVSPMGFAN